MAESKVKRRPKPKPRVTQLYSVEMTQLDRIELRLRKINLAFDGVEHYIELRQHCAVLASHNRRLLEQHDELTKQLQGLRVWIAKQRIGGTITSETTPAATTPVTSTPYQCIHHWQLVAGGLDGEGEWYKDQCTLCPATRRRYESAT